MSNITSRPAHDLTPQFLPSLSGGVVPNGLTERASIVHEEAWVVLKLARLVFSEYAEQEEVKDIARVMFRSDDPIRMEQITGIFAKLPHLYSSVVLTRRPDIYKKMMSKKWMKSPRIVPFYVGNHEALRDTTFSTGVEGVMYSFGGPQDGPIERRTPLAESTMLGYGRGGTIMEFQRAPDDSHNRLLCEVLVNDSANSEDVLESRTGIDLHEGTHVMVDADDVELDPNTRTLTKKLQGKLRRRLRSNERKVQIYCLDLCFELARSTAKHRLTFRNVENIEFGALMAYRLLRNPWFDFTSKTVKTRPQVPQWIQDWACDYIRKHNELPWDAVERKARR